MIGIKAFIGGLPKTDLHMHVGAASSRS